MYFNINLIFMNEKISLKMISFIVIWILFFWLVAKWITFNNQMITLNERIDNELESTKVNYSQCLIKIWEVNDIAKAYKNDLFEISVTAWNNLNSFSEQLMTWFNTKIIPEVSPSLRENVQIEIVSCRNAYVWKVDLDLKPLYTVYNTSLQIFPNNLINLILNYEKKEFIMPKTEEVNKSFETWIDKKLDLN